MRSLFNDVDFFVQHQVARKLQAPPDIVTGQVGVIAVDDLLGALASGSQVEHLRNLDSCSTDAGLATADVRADGDTLHKDMVEQAKPRKQARASSVRGFMRPESYSTASGIAVTRTISKASSNAPVAACA